MLMRALSETGESPLADRRQRTEVRVAGLIDLNINQRPPERAQALIYPLKPSAHLNTVLTTVAAASMCSATTAGSGAFQADPLAVWLQRRRVAAACQGHPL